jgi:hypothetical protein
MCSKFASSTGSFERTDIGASVSGFSLRAGEKAAANGIRMASILFRCLESAWAILFKSIAYSNEMTEMRIFESSYCIHCGPQ